MFRPCPKVALHGLGAQAILPAMATPSDHSATELAGNFLIAMPGMEDPRFAQSVVLLCAHSVKGAMGLIVNKPSTDVRMSDILEQLDIATVKSARDMTVYFGGPVEMGRGFVLHSPDYASSLKTLAVPSGFAMTATLDILEALASGGGPRQAMLTLGYASWGPGQLEQELGMNAWLTAPGDTSIVFDTAASKRWEKAIRSLGIDPLVLSSTAGHA